MACVNFSSSAKRWAILVCLAGVSLTGCPRPVSIPTPTGPPADEAVPEREVRRPDDSAPSEAETAQQARRSVADEMLRQGRSLLDSGQTDAAIRVLERAASMDPAGGRPYFYLAEAWYRKQNADRARQFHALAERALGQDPQWVRRLGRQLDRIDELEQ